MCLTTSALKHARSWRNPCASEVISACGSRMFSQFDPPLRLMSLSSIHTIRTHNNSGCTKIANARPVQAVVTMNRYSRGHMCFCNFSRTRACLVFHAFGQGCTWIVIGRTGVVSHPRGALVALDTVACGSLRAVDIFQRQLVHSRDPHPELDGPIIDPAIKSYTGRTMSAEGTPLALCHGGAIYHGEHGLIILCFSGRLPTCHTRGSRHSAIPSSKTHENPWHGLKLARWLLSSGKHW